jgi:hypothetical protein
VVLLTHLHPRQLQVTTETPTTEPQVEDMLSQTILQLQAMVVVMRKEVTLTMDLVPCMTARKIMEPKLMVTIMEARET